MTTDLKEQDSEQEKATGEGMAERSDEKNEGAATVAPVAGSAEALQNGADPGAPFGRKKDGTPRKSNAGRRSEPGAGQPVEAPVGQANGTESTAAKHERLARVRPAARSEQPPQQVPVAPGADYTSLGRDAAMLWIGVGQMMFGPAWAPETNADGTFTQEGRGEVIALRDAFGACFKEWGLDKIPPVVQLCIVLGVYTAKRAQKPEIRNRLANGWAWVKSLPSRAFGIFRRAS